MHLRTILAATAVGILLAGCASTVGTQRTTTIVPGAPYSLSTAEQTAIKKGVTASLKDPTSALFGDMQATKSVDGVVTVCGYVNGKNSFGGYVGDKPFIGAFVSSGDFVVAAMGGSDNATYATFSVCRQSGITI